MNPEFDRVCFCWMVASERSRSRTGERKRFTKIWNEVEDSKAVDAMMIFVDLHGDGLEYSPFMKMRGGVNELGKD